MFWQKLYAFLIVGIVGFNTLVAIEANGQSSSEEEPDPIISLMDFYGLDGHRDNITCMATQGNWIISGSLDGTVRVWDFKTLECKDIRCIGFPVVSIAVKALPLGGLRILAGYTNDDNQGRLYVSDLFSSNPVFVNTVVNQIFGSRVNALVFLDNTDSAALACETRDHQQSHDFSIEILCLQNGHSVEKTEALKTDHASSITHLTYWQEKKLLVSANLDGLIKLWDLKSNTCFYSKDHHDDIITLLTMGQDCVIAGSCSSGKIWNLTNDTVCAFDSHGPITKISDTQFLFFNDPECSSLIAHDLELNKIILTIGNDVDTQSDGSYSCSDSSDEQNLVTHVLSTAVINNHFICVGGEGGSCSVLVSEKPFYLKTA